MPLWCRLLTNSRHSSVSTRWSQDQITAAACTPFELLIRPPYRSSQLTSFEACTYSRCHASALAVQITSTATSAWVSRLDQFLPHLRCPLLRDFSTISLPNAVATSSRKSWSFTRRCRPMCGWGDFRGLRLRVHRSISLSGAGIVMIRDGEGRRLKVHSYVPHVCLRSRCLVGIKPIRFEPRPLEEYDIPFFGVLKNAFTITRS